MWIIRWVFFTIVLLALVSFMGQNQEDEVIIRQRAEDLREVVAVAGHPPPALADRHAREEHGLVRGDVDQGDGEGDRPLVRRRVGDVLVAERDDAVAHGHHEVEPPGHLQLAEETRLLRVGQVEREERVDVPVGDQVAPRAVEARGRADYLPSRPFS